MRKRERERDREREKERERERDRERERERQRERERETERDREGNDIIKWHRCTDEYRNSVSIVAKHISVFDLYKCLTP